LTVRPSLGALAWRAFVDVNRTLGGGLPAMELMRRSFTRSGWLDAAGHGLLVAVSRFTPGTNVLAYGAGLGWLMQGVGGVAVVLLAASVPGALVATLLSSVLSRLVGVPAVRLALGLLTLVAAGLIVSSAWALVRPYVVTSRRGWALGVVGLALALSWVGFTPVRVLLVAAVVGALTPVREDA
jgi:chromate transport protein ChrA